MTQRDDAGRFRFSTMVYSAPKKSGKTTIAAGLVLWQAWRIGRGACYVVGNDLKQADNRLFRVIEYTVTHHPAMRNMAKVRNYNIALANGTTIEALPIDPRGEAGMNPTNITFTEMWGAKGSKAELMWTEAVLSPSRAGHAFKLIESYAGHVGESVILERVHQGIVQPSYLVDPDHELYANDATGTGAYWCTRRTMPWQTGLEAERYYASEAAEKTDMEFRRQHHNEWVSSTNTFVPPEWWHACRGDIPAYNGQSVVIGLDAAVSNDSFAIVGVIRDGERVIVLFTRVYKPDNGPLDFGTIEADLRQMLIDYNVVCVTYDPYQLHDMATRLKREMAIWFKAFNQGSPRLTADKALHDRIRDGALTHDGGLALTEHILNAQQKADGDSKLRIIKRSPHLKIDAAVALSMAADTIGRLNL
ncbi:hypothetical protein HC928_01455 [bacterium]|nr:hypothetical protein [bacterium]